MVEQLTLNQLVRGSSPRGATNLASSESGEGFFDCQKCRKLKDELTPLRGVFRRRSSMAEHLFCKQVVAGSTPVAGSTSANQCLDSPPA